MKIKSIKFKNFASYGNKIQSIDFNDSGDLYLVLGSNGTGKSTLAKIITYLCYGKVDGSNLKDLPNRINSNLWGEIILESKKNTVKIIRGISPNIFKVFLNNVEYDVAGKSNLQDFLDEEIFDIPYNVFKNIIILSINDFKSFISMSPADKKQIIDKIFGFSVINEMKEIVKNDKKGLAEKLKFIKNEIKNINDSIDSVNKKIEEYQKKSKERDLIETTEFKNKLKNLKDKKEETEKIKNQLFESIEELSTEKSEKERELISIKNDINNTNKQIKLFDAGVCPTCNSNLKTDEHQKIKDVKLLELNNLEELKESVNSEYNNISSKLSNLKSEFESVNNNFVKIKENVKYVREKLTNISTNKENETDSYLQNLIDGFNEKLKTIESEKNTKEANYNYLNLLESILGDDGIKNLAVNNILPSLNTHIEYMCNELGISFKIKFDNKFNCVIQHLGIDINTKSLSTGEKKKVDFAIIIALIKLIKIKFPSINILFLDEIFSSIDSNGRYHIIKILNKLITDLELNALVINHSELPNEFFTKKIEIAKKAGFSEFTIEPIK